MKKIFLAALALPFLALHACKKDDPAVPHTFNGTATKVGAGTARSWVETDDQNHPKTVGISFDKTAFTNLPAGDEAEYMLPLPAKGSLTPFTMVMLDWNPHGHPPAHVYDLPHFDMHFYMMSESERQAIPEYEADSTGFLKYPGQGYIPETYVPIPGGEAKMGTHWVDIMSPELSQTDPQKFTQTFVYGSYNGAVSFYEPMATLDYLTTTKAYTRDIPQPKKFGRDGYYPTKMSFTDKGGTMEVTLYDFVYHAKS